MSSPALLPLCLRLLGLAAPVLAEEAPTPSPETPAAPAAVAPALERSQEQQQALMRQLPAEQEQTVRRLRAWLDRLPPAASGSPAAS